MVMEMDKVWWYSKEDKKIGAISLNELLECLVCEQINLETLIWKQGWDNWIKLTDVEEIRTEVNKTISDKQAKTPPPLPNKAEEILTTEHIEYAGFWQRWVALTLDNLILFPFFIPLFLIEAADAHLRYHVITFFMVAIASAIYFTRMESSDNGATYGKRWVGIKVVNLEGKKLTAGRAFSRWITHSVSYIFYIGYCIQPFTFRKQAWHDMLSKTIVIQAEKTKPLPSLVKVSIIIVIAWIFIGIIAAVAIPFYHDSAPKPKPTGAIVSQPKNENYLGNGINMAKVQKKIFDHSFNKHSDEKLSWREVASMPEFQSLPLQDQLQARNDYFREVVLPQVPQKERFSVFNEFNAFAESLEPNTNLK